MIELFAEMEKIQKLDFETKELIKLYFFEEKFKKEEFILAQGKVCEKIYFIKSGVVRRFYMEDDKEIVSWIYTENQFFTSLSSYFEQKPSFEIFTACDETIVYSLSFQDELKLLDYPIFAQFHIKFLRVYLSKLNEFHHIFRFMSAQEKYDFLLKSSPDIIKNSKLKHIASLIGVSQETLSRIRAGII